jgi:hypothetical protein
MARSVLGVVSTLLVSVVEVSPYVEFDAGFDGEFVCANAPEDLGLFARVETIDVDELVCVKRLEYWNKTD